MVILVRPWMWEGGRDKGEGELTGVEMTIKVNDGHRAVCSVDGAK